MSRIKNLILGTFAVLILVAIFILLGFWQLDRAAQVKELQKPYIEKPIVELAKVAKPNRNLAGESVNRIVSFTGTYVTQLFAPNQIDNKKVESTWSIGLMEIDGGGYLLVVRSYEPSELPRGDVAVTGRLIHRQFDDVSPNAQSSKGELRRIDPSLVVAQYGGDYYDGYVVAQSEEVNGRIISAERVTIDPVQSTVPGYYWQHIAYVIIWWLMALVVLFLPIYSRLRERNQ
ncbi:MAG: SURF1 family protein [Actinomycetales bacterium]